MDAGYLDVGRVRSANPSRRSVRLEVTESRLADFQALEWLYTRGKDGQVLRLPVESARVTGSGVAIVTLAPEVSEDDAARLKGYRVLLPESDAKSRDTFEIEAEEFAGLRMETVDGALVGEVAAGFNTKANGVLEVEREDGGTFLMPLVPEAVVSVDWDARRIVVQPLEPFAVDQDSRKT